MKLPKYDPTHSRHTHANVTIRFSVRFRRPRPGLDPKLSDIDARHVVDMLNSVGFSGSLLKGSVWTGIDAANMRKRAAKRKAKR